MSESSSSQSEPATKSPPLAKTKKNMVKLKTKSPIKSDDTKKLTTKQMLLETLSELKNRKGVSLYAVKKHITEKYDIEMKSKEHILKKVLKNEIESGTIVKTTGIGVSGSFKLARKVNNTKTEKPKKKVQKTKAPKKTEEGKEDIVKKITKKKEKISDKKAATTDTNSKKPKQLTATKELEVKKITSLTSTDEAVPKKQSKKKKIEPEKQMKTKKMTPIMKRKSLGSIIKAPKMKPKSLKATKL